MATIRLSAGRVKPVWAGHPWVYAQAIDTIEGAPGPGDVVTVTDPKGGFLGRGFYSPESAIPVRILSRDEEEMVDDIFLGRRLDDARAFRTRLGWPSDETTGYRLVHAEGDGLAGLVVDIFGDTTVVQLRTAGMKRREDQLFAHIQRVTGARVVIEAAASLKKSEGFDASWRVVRGADADALRFRERDFDFEVPRTISQKTGYYFDQRSNRARVEGLANGARVLDAFCFLGGMGLAAARGGAEHVLSVDSSAPAIGAASASAKRNGLELEFRKDDIKSLLPSLYQRGERFDLVIVDPPKLVPTRRHRSAGLRAYTRLNNNAAKLVKNGGILVSCSCSAAIAMRDLLHIVASAARRSHRRAEVFHLGYADDDHPSPAAFHEGRYLKAVFARMII